MGRAGGVPTAAGVRRTATATAPAPAAGGGDNVQQLKELAALKQQGILTDEEFATEKARISRTEGDQRGPAMSTRGTGSALFASIMLMVAGTVNVIYGIAAIGDSQFFVG